MTIAETGAVVEAVAAIKKDLHEWVIITTREGHQQAVHVDPNELAKVHQQFEDLGQEAYILLEDVKTGEKFGFPGNVAVFRSFSHKRFEELNEEADEKRKAAKTTQQSQVIIPGRRP